MSNAALNNLLKDYEMKKYFAELEFDNKRNAFYSSHPELNKVNTELGRIALDISKAILAQKDEEAEALKAKFNELKAQKDELLASIDVPSDVLEPVYECPICKDTGFITNSEGKSILCNCLKQRLFDINFNKSNIGNLDKENFDNFDINLYSDIPDEKKFGAKISPRKNIENIKKIALNFIDNFNNPEGKSLLFTGNTGLGKTFLSNCIAKEILSQGKTVLYQTAPIMLDNIIDYKFGKSDFSDLYDNIINVDLLIIDDLGAETCNSVKLTELTNIINSRILNQNHHVTKTIISTNLNANNLLATYNERIFSRLVMYYDFCRFFGDDIRLSKAFGRKTLS